MRGKQIKGGNHMEAYQTVFQRKEVKYLLSTQQLQALMPLIRQHMEPDMFSHSSIGSLYYDTPDYRLIRRSLEKPEYKEKLRLRSYGVPGSDSPVFPEIKKKAGGIVYKRRVSMGCEDAMDYLGGRCPGPEGQIFRELDWMLSAYPGLAPRVFLGYERDSWKGRETPDLRLTLDRDIRYRFYDLDLRWGFRGTSILPPGSTLMEIKIPGAAPMWLSHALSEIGIFPTSFSKYGESYKQICCERNLRKYA